VQFEEGDAMYERDARTVYAMISKSFFDVSLTALYGQTKYKLAAVDSKDYKSNELSFWAGYGFTKNLSADLGYSYINTSDNDTNKLPDLNQVNLTLTYKF
jgi:opacity protein-like surface antigen